jgi:RHS repeat-associated protein
MASHGAGHVVAARTRGWIVTLLSLSLACAGLAVVVVAGLTVVAGPATAAGAGGDSSAEADALAEAARTGNRVEVVEDDTETETVYANPDGTLTSEITQQPVRVPDDNGDLVPVDLDLETHQGELTPQASATDVSFSGTGDGALASFNTPGTGSFALRLDASVAAPDVDGATASYPVADVAADSLDLRAAVNGFSARLQLDSAPDAAPTYDFPLTLNGLHASLSGNQLRLANDDGTVVAESAPLRMWDSQVDGGGDPSNVATVDSSLVTIDGQTVLRLTPSMDYLTAASTVYPVTVDPDVTSIDRRSDTTVSSADPDTTFWSDYRVRVGSPDGTKKFRSFEEFNIDRYIGKDVTKATLSMFQFYAATCNAKTTNAYATDIPYGHSMTWNDQPTIVSGSMWNSSASGNHGIEGSCANDTQASDVTRQINGYATGEQAGQWTADTDDSKPFVATIELRADNETDANGEKRFCSMNAASAPSGSACLVSGRLPTLSITYVPDLGVQNWYSMSNHGLNSVSKLGINNGNGNAVVTAKDLHIAGIGQDLELDRYYNAQRQTIDGLPASSLGTSGWSLGMGPDVYLEQNSGYPSRYDYHSPTGTIFGDYVRQSSDSSSADYRKFSEPIYGGVDASLKDDNNSGPATFTMTFHSSQTKYVFADVDSSDNNLYLYKVIDRNDNTIQFNYVNGTHKLSTIVDTAGRSLSVAYNGSNQITTITDTNGPSTRTWQYGYNTSGQLASYTDPTGAETDYTYSGTTAPYYLTKITDPAQSSGVHPTRMIGYNSSQATSVQYQYGVSGSTPIYREFDFTYQSTPDAACPSGADRSSIMTDVNDQPGGKTTFCFTDRKAGADRVTDVYDGEGNRRSTTYTPDQKAASYTTPGNQASSNASKASYASSPRDQLQSVTQPTDNSGDTAAKTTYKYNADSSIPGYQYLPTSMTDTNGNCTAYTYWKPSDTGEAAGQVKNAYIGLTPSSNDCSGSTSAAQWHNDYNSNGTIADTYDANGSATAAGETRYVYWQTGDTGIALHGASELKQIIKPGGFCSSPRSLCTSFTYDGLGRVLTKTDGRGKVTTYSYDKDDRVTQVLFDGATTCTTSAGTCIQYNYDSEGNLTSRADGQGTSSFTYDWLNQQRTQSTPDATVLTTTYDAVGNLMEYDQSVTSGGTVYTDAVTYQYNRANQAIGVTDNAGTANEKKMTLTRDNNSGKVSAVDYPTSHNLHVSTGYKPSGKPSGVTASASAPINNLVSYTYSYVTSSGNETTHLQKVVTTGPASMDPGTITYGYNAKNELNSASDTNTDNATFPDYSYTYDDTGNMTSKGVGSTTTYYGYDATGDLCWKGSTNGTHSANSCPATPSGDTSYSHDAAGNNTGISASPLAYNAAGQASSLAGVSQSYLDQTNDLRVTSGSVRSINAPLGITARITSSGAAPTFYTRTPDGDLLDEHGNINGSTGYRYYVTDGLGSVVALVDPVDRLAASYVYDPSGGTTVNNETGGTTAAGNPFRYRGGYQDATEGDGLYHFGARYYDPSTARFTQPDPKTGNIKDPLTTLSYAYASGDPTDRTDPTGRSNWWEVGLGALDTLSGLGTIGSGVTIGVLTGWSGVGIFAGAVVVGLGVIETSVGVYEIYYGYEEE